MSRPNPLHTRSKQQKKVIRTKTTDINLNEVLQQGRNHKYKSLN